MIVQETITEEVFLPTQVFHANLTNSLKELLNDDKLPNVTLVSDEHMQTKAHKLVLAACSPVLKELLLNCGQIDPVLHLCDVKHKDLQLILEFIYLVLLFCLIGLCL